MDAGSQSFRPHSHTAAKRPGQYDVTTPVESLWAEIKTKLDEFLDQYVPSKVSTKRFNQPWINRKIKRLAKKKQ